MWDKLSICPGFPIDRLRGQETALSYPALRKDGCISKTGEARRTLAYPEKRSGLTMRWVMSGNQRRGREEIAPQRELVNYGQISKQAWIKNKTSYQLSYEGCLLEFGF